MFDKVAHVAWETTVLGLPLTGLTASALLGITVLLILDGRLIPRRQYQQVVAERDAWHAAHTVSEEGRTVISKQLDKALEVGHSVQTVMSALARAQARGEDRAGAEEDISP